MIFGLRILPKATLNIVAALIRGCASMMIYAGVSGIYPAAGINVQLKKLRRIFKKVVKKLLVFKQFFSIFFSFTLPLMVS